MRVRRQGGATLGLTAACVLLVIVIGVGFYFLSKIIGGGREVANATDAGALNVAKQALKRGTVTLTQTQLAEFGGVCDPPGSNTVNLITYNRIVAQAMMVAANAAAEDPSGNNTNAQHNAQATALQAQQIGQALKASLVAATTSSLPNDFNSIAKDNNTKMWNGNTVACTTISAGYLKPKGSTNIIFDPATIAAFNGWTPNDLTTGPSASNAPNNVDSLGAPVGNGAHYMPGYDFNTFNNTGIKLTGVPVFPNTKPHLIDIGTFNSDLATNLPFQNDNDPANAFHANAQAVEAKSGNMGGTLACAVVGVLNKDYKASFPRGFVRINNGPDAVATNGSFGVPISDGTNDIFNNQLYTGPGAPSTANGIFQANGVFTTNLSDLAAWGAFNGRTGQYDNSTQTVPQNNAQVMINQGLTGRAWVAYNVNPAGHAYPPGAFVPQADLPQIADSNIQGPAPESLYDMALNPANYDNTPVPGSGLRSGGGCNEFATIAQLEAIAPANAANAANQGNFNCVYTMYDDNLGAPCGDQNTVLAWQNNYQCTTTFPTNNGLATSGNNQGVTNVEYLKAELLVKIAGRLGGHYCADVSIPTEQPSGVKYYSQGVPGTPGTNAVAFDPRYSGSGASPVVNFETVNTPLKYLQQISAANGLGACASNSTTGIIEQMTQRMQQIESSVTSAQVQAALDTQPLHLKNATGIPTADNGTLYLYVDPSSRQVVMAPNLPSTWSDSTTNNSAFPDGLTPQQTGNGECSDYYPLNGWAVNTVFTKTNDGNGNPKGDAHYHDQPFTLPGNPGPGVGYGGVPGQSAGDPAVAMVDQPYDPSAGSGPPIYGQDAAIFRQSSGAQNNLGVLNFQETTQGTTFCKPN